MNSETEKLIQGRNCGECTACCEVLRIEDAQLKKLADEPCPNCVADGGCRIYASRPEVCRTWYCGWRRIEDLGDEWRPDRSGLVIRLNVDHSGRIVLQPMRDPLDVMCSAPVLGIVAGWVSMSIPVSASVAKKPGFCHALAELNNPILPAVQSRVFERAKAVMAEAVRHAQQATTEPVIPL